MPTEFEVEDKISELLRRDLQGFQCPVCGRHEFAEFDELSAPLRTNLMHYEGDDPIRKARARLISITCDNCGHIEQFVEEPLRRRAMAFFQVET